MLHILYGQDDFSRRDALQQLKAGLSRDVVESNSVLLDGAHLTVAQLRGECDALPFFASSRLVIVEGLLERFETKYGKHPEKRRQSADSELIEELAGYVPQMPPSTVLILLDGEVKPANTLFKRLAHLGKVQVFPAVKGQRLNYWIQEHVTAKGSHITPEAARLLGEHASDDLWSVSNEIDKLLLYAPGPVITEADVMAAISGSREASQFAFMDAVIARQLGTAQRLLHQLLEEGSKAQQILAFVARELGLILKAREATERRMSRQDMQATLGINSGFRLEKMLTHAKTTDIGRLIRSFELVLEADLSIKTGEASDLAALGLLVAELCQA